MLKKLSNFIFLFVGLASFGQECPILSYPTDGSTAVPVDATITWSAVNQINGYLISLGTTPGGTDITNTKSLGLINYYKPPVGLPENTVIYVSLSIIPVNAVPKVCHSITFTTIDVTTPPPCTILVAPDNNASNVTVVTDIIWQYAPTATSYTLSIGTSEGGVDILDNLNVGNTLSYDPPVDLPQDVWIYITIKPSNENGNMGACTIENFFTGPMADPCVLIDEQTGEAKSLGPEIDFLNRIGMCEGNPINLDTNAVADGFRWYLNINGTETLLSENRNIRITDTGNYRLEAYNIVVRSGIPIECSSSKNFSVVSSEIATIESVDIIRLISGKEVTINAVGIGNYEYAMDDENGPYQNDSVFENISEGPHIVYVRDKNGCGIAFKVIERELALSDFPNFFTPNGDGVNDFWQFIPPPENDKIVDIVKGRISIFDRYGRLLVQIDPKSHGWDGSYKGDPVPSSDYWFSAVSFDRQEIKGHFALKR